MPKAKPQAVQATVVSVKYIGKKDKKFDNVAGTGLTWSPGEIHVLPYVQAVRLLAYPDVWVNADKEVAEDPGMVGAVINSLPDDPQTSVEQPPETTIDMPNLGGMTVADIVAYAQREFHTDLDPATPKDALIDKVVSLRNVRDTLGVTQ